MELLKEGKIKFYADNLQTKSAGVFFNPSRSFERNLNITLIKAIGRSGLEGIELFSASGVRGLRLCAETENFKRMVLNDIKTIKTIERNIKLNKIKNASSLEINAAKVNCLGEHFDYIDIDPFGSPVGYLQNSFASIRMNGIMAITATDTAPLYGRAKKACRLKYGASSMKTHYYNELGLRILIKRSEELANIMERSIEPIFFDVRKHYIRVYFRVVRPHKSEKIGFIYQCRRCPNRTLEESTKCSNCGSDLLKLGPVWLGRLFDRNLVESMLALSEDKTERKYLESLAHETDQVSYYTTDELASYLKKPEVSISAVKSRTVLNPKGFRTDDEIADVLGMASSPNQ